MAKVKLNEKQLKVGQRELDGAYNASQQKKKNARRMIESGSGKFKDGAKKIFEAESQRQKEIEELCNIFDAALKKIKSPEELEADKRAKSAATKTETERVKRDIKKLNASDKKIDVELSELEIKIIVASLKRSENAVKRGKINATGAEYLKQLIKDFENLI